MRILGDSYQGLIEQLLCPGCGLFMDRMMYLCKGGHSLCQDCRNQSRICVVCSQEITYVMNRKLFAITRWLCVSCTSEGCSARIPHNKGEDHTLYCAYSFMCCPVNRIRGQECTWNGKKKDFTTHIKEIHNDRLILNSSFDSTPLESDWKFVLIDDEIFLFFKQYEYCRILLHVQQVEITRKQFVSTFELKARNGIDYIKATLAVGGTKDNFLNLFRKKNCLRILSRTMRIFGAERNINLKVYIKEVKIA